MTEQSQLVPASGDEDDDVGDLQKLHAGLVQHRVDFEKKFLRRPDGKGGFIQLAPPSTVDLAREVFNWLLPMQRQIIERVAQIRDTTWQALDAVETRLENVENTVLSETTQIEEEHADKFLACFEAGVWLAELVQQSAQLDADAAKKLAEFKALCEECKGIVQENVLEVEEQDDDEDDDENGKTDDELVHTADAVLRPRSS